MRINTVKGCDSSRTLLSTIGPQILSNKNKILTTKEMLFWDLIKQTEKESKGKAKN